MIETDVAVPMRDGTRLVADVYRPSEGRHPVLLARTPYGKSSEMTEGMIRAQWTASQGFAVVVQDCRGRGGSDGTWVPFHSEIDDGYDTIEWCASQPWSTGKVGMCGTSYVAATQWLAAISSPPSLRCIFPIVGAADFHDGWVYQGGAFYLAFVGGWTADVLTPPYLDRMEMSDEERQSERARLRQAGRRVRASFSQLPLEDLPVFKREGLAPYFYEWLEHPSFDDYWRRISIAANHERVTVPAFSIGAWYDLFLAGSPRNFAGLRERAANEQARSGQRLVMGPWTHSAGELAVGQRVFGLDAEFPIHEKRMEWSRHWLQEDDPGEFADPPVRIYVINDGWRDEQEWPLERTQYTPFYLHSRGRAQSQSGDGSLSTDEPTGDEPADVFLYNPRNAVGTVGAGGVFDQRPAEDRTDVLVYSTPPLDVPVEVTGPIKLVLHASTSTPDTDWTAKLIDVAPDGYAANVCDGILRARYRESYEREDLCEPGVPDVFEIDMLMTSNLFLPGHRIRLELSSSNFPKFDRNPNSGTPVAGERAQVVALQTVFHTAERPSQLLLPVIPRL